MTEKELKKLNRYQLLDMLIVQTQRADRLEKELEAVRAELEAQQIRLSNLGSIAEAAMQVNGIFESAQKAADMYLDAARLQAKIIEEEARKSARIIIKQAEVADRFSAYLLPRSKDT